MVRLRWTLAGCAVFAGAFLTALTGAAPWVAPATQPPVRVVPGREIAVILISSSTCAASADPALPGQVERVRNAVSAQAHSRDASFASLGIARDTDAEAGIDHLRRFGRFDELISGRGWLNTGLVRYVWEDIPGRAVTPQILVVERTIVDRFGPDAAQSVVRGERLLLRKVGLREIDRWVEAGSPLPADG